MRTLPVLLLLAPLRTRSVATSEDDVGAAALAEVYLAEEEFPGMHLLQIVDAGERFLVHRGGRRLAPGNKSLEADASGWGSRSKMRSDLEVLLRIPPREPLELDWALFDKTGLQLDDVVAMRNAGLVFLFEIGRWMWPAVRVGFEHKVEDVKKGHPVLLRTLSLRPVVFEVRDFFDASECEEVRRIGAQQGLKASEGQMQSADLKRGTAHSSFRTSRQAWLSNSFSPVIAELDDRTARLTRVPATHNEPVQLLRYDEGQFYHAHMDWTELDFYPGQQDTWVNNHFGHQDRLATVFWYLNDIAEGGETIFPKHGHPICFPESRGGPQTRFCAGADDPVFSSCEHGLKVTPRQGTVILWYNFLATGRGDRNALHAGCSVGKNLTKWSGNKWVRLKPIHSQGQWIPDHPALFRHGFSPDYEGCIVAITNTAEVEAHLFWVRPDGGQDRLASLQPKQTVSQNSVPGHKFLFRADGRNSNIVRCRPPETNYVLTPSFVLEEQKHGEL